MRRNDGDFETQRLGMVATQLRGRGITDERVLSAMARVPRQVFVDEEHRGMAYEDKPVPIECGQTISQPYMVALMTQLLELNADSRVLEIGTGSGYQAAILGCLAKSVISVERHEELAHCARRNLRSISIENVLVRVGDGTLGAPDMAPFDSIIVTAGGPDVPEALMDQLAVGGCLVCPVGNRKTQEIVVVSRDDAGFKKTKSIRCRFVPLIGEEGWNE